MDINSHSPQQQPVHRESPVEAPVVPRRTRGPKQDNMWARVGIVAALLAVVVLLIGVIGLLYSQNTNTKDDESKYIKTNRLQAVFLNTGQVYFGNINTLNNNFLVLTNIFYLQTTSSGSSSSTSSTSSSNNVTLVKLGCELHMPYDQMVINRAQVTFWENLQPDGQVAQAVSKFNSENPNGQKCTDQSSSSGNTSSTVQSAGTKQ